MRKLGHAGLCLIAVIACGCEGQIGDGSAGGAGGELSTGEARGSGGAAAAATACETAADCDDAIACTDDRCDAATGSCMHDPLDADGDGHAAIECVDADGEALGADCDDDALLRGPDQAEICDGLDNDCDGAVDEDATDIPWYADADLDGFGGETVVEDSCLPVPGASPMATDCDDDDRTRNPGATEACSGADDDCDGAVDELGVCDDPPPADAGTMQPCGGGAVNACDGCGTLAIAPGTLCGACEFDVYVCDGPDATACGGDTVGNACGGCDVLADQPGASCGRCGLDAFVCDGASSTVCDGDTAGNACGGCATLSGDPGDACGSCGLDAYACDGTEAVSCDGDTAGNVCGGCDVLGGQPGDACGRCGLDSYGCQGQDLTCDGDTAGNACGGCGGLPNDPGYSCGRCGLDSYACDGAEAVACDGDTAGNACGGCGGLSNDPGYACGRCGLDSYACDGTEAVLCDGDTADNACGGCNPLGNAPGSACGQCGLDSYVCNGPEAVACSGDTAGNACGGCQNLAEPPGNACGPCGLDSLICVTDDATACDGRTYGNGCYPPEDVPDEPYFDSVAMWDPAWVAFEEEVLVLVNQHRAAGADCGSEGSFGSALPLDFDPRLRGAARLHSLDMYERQFFAHTNPDGVDPFERMTAAGYNWNAAGENIAGGYVSPADVVDGWMNSDGHCSNIMSPSFTEIGIGYHPGGGDYRRMWTQVFGRQP